MARAHIIIHGCVQGVFFRKFVREHAIQLNLKGYTKNLDNGNVEVVAEGNIFDIKKLIELCEKGTPASHVERVDVIFEKSGNEFSDFSIRY